MWSPSILLLGRSGQVYWVYWLGPTGKSYGREVTIVYKQGTETLPSVLLVYLWEGNKKAPKIQPGKVNTINDFSVHDNMLDVQVTSYPGLPTFQNFTWKSERPSQSGDVIRCHLRCSCTHPMQWAVVAMATRWTVRARYTPTSRTASNRSNFHMKCWEHGRKGRVIKFVTIWQKAASEGWEPGLLNIVWCSYWFLLMIALRLKFWDFGCQHWSFFTNFHMTRLPCLSCVHWKAEWSPGTRLIRTKRNFMYWSRYVLYKCTSQC